jgi:intracellular sulfur oxidation DsrE/DsrF family protein
MNFNLGHTLASDKQGGESHNFRRCVMSKNRWFAVPVVISLISLSTYAADGVGAKADKPLHIDIPVKLEKANVVLNIDHLAFVGDMPIAIGHLGLLVGDFSADKTKGLIIGLFHTDAGHVTLNDQAYNVARNVTTGNPYKGLIMDLMKRGVQIELCGATAKAHGSVNSDLLPGVKVNTDAMSRLSQLHEQGYTEIKE